MPTTDAARPVAASATVAPAWWRGLSRRQAAVAAAAAFGAASFAVAVLLWLVGVSDGTVVLAVIFGPLLIYLVASGDVSEISGPGGLSAKFRAIANAPIDATAEIEQIQIIGKESLDRLVERARVLHPGAPVALAFSFGGAVPYDRFTMERYLDHLLKIDPALAVVFQDPMGRFVASCDGPSVVSVIANDHLGQEFETAVGAGDIAGLRRLVPLTTQHIARNEANATALRKMLDDRVKSIVAVDDETRAVGVVRRDDIVARMIASLSR